MLPKTSKIFNLVTFAGLGAIYLSSVSRTATGIADSDELITSAYLLSPAHPPGYGLNVILLHLFQRLFFFINPAHASNLLAAVLHWVTLVVIYRITQTVLKETVPKFQTIYILPGIVLFGLSPLFWRYAAVMEVMSLGNLLAALTLYFGIRWYQEEKTRDLVLTALVFGLGVSHLQTIILFGPGLLILFAVRRLNSRQPIRVTAKTLATALSLLLVGFLAGTLLLIPLNGHRAEFAWDFPATANGWWRMITRADYAGYSIDGDREITNPYVGSLSSTVATLKQLPLYATFCWNYLQGPALLFILAALYTAWRKKSVLLCVIVIDALIAGILLGTYVTVPKPDDYQLRYAMMQAIAERQYLIGYIPLALLTCIGIGLALSWYQVSTALMAALVMGLAVSGYMGNRTFGDMSRYPYVYETYKQALLKVEPDAAILCSSDTSCYTLYYLSLVEQVRPDVTVLTHMTKSRRYFLEAHPEYVGHLYLNEPYFYAQLIAWNTYHRPTYLTNIDAYYVDYVGLDGNPFYLQPETLLYKVRTDKPDVLAAFAASESSLLSMGNPDNRDLYTLALQNYFANHFDISGRLAARAGDTSQARDYFEYAVTLNDKEDELIGWMQYTDEYAEVLGYANRVSTPAATLYRQAVAADSRHSAEEAYTLARKSFYLDPTKPEPLELLVKLYRENNFAEAAEITREHLRELTSN